MALGESTNTEPIVPRVWDFWRSGPAEGLRNMAVDAALLRRASSGATPPPGGGCGVWRCYSWSRPTVSFGRNETTLGRFDALSVAAAGMEAVRRPTGGRALLHAREITYSASFPLARPVSWRAAYEAVNRLLQRALGSLGVDAAIVPYRAGNAAAPPGPLCFDRPDAGEIVVGGAKLAGSAVWRERGGYLQHGSILLHDEQPLLTQAASNLMATPPRAAGLAALLRVQPAVMAADHRDDDERIRRAVEAAIEATLAAIGTVTAFGEEASLDADIASFEREFAHPSWLWRR